MRKEERGKAEQGVIFGRQCAVSTGGTVTVYNGRFPKPLMRTIFVLTAALAASVSALAQTSPVHFRGILKLGDTQHFSLTAEGGGKTAWVAVGDTFSGYEVVRFDAKENMLVIRKGDEEHRLALAGSKSADAAPAEEGAALDEAAELLRSMKFEEMMATSIDQQKKMMEKMFRQIGQQTGMPVTEEMVAAQMRFIEAFHEEMDWAGMQEDMIQAYGETFTREELQGLIDFYTTPAGQSFINKQGELMQRMSELMQPRMMNAMNKLQPMMQEMREAGRKGSGGAPNAP